MTSVPNKDREVVVSVIRKLGGFSLEGSVTESTTHVVFSQPRRTLTALTAIARGCWLLSIDWVYKSVESGHWVDEKPFEVDDLFPAAKVCREERMTCEGQYNSRLFSSCPPIFISHDTDPPAERLSQLVMLCGGKLTMSRRRDNALCVGRKASSGGTWVSEQWIMDCVTQNRLVSTGKYSIE
jgi:microcephalin